MTYDFMIPFPPTLSYSTAYIHINTLHPQDSPFIVFAGPNVYRKMKPRLLLSMNRNGIDYVSSERSSVVGMTHESTQLDLENTKKTGLS